MPSKSQCCNEPRCTLLRVLTSCVTTLLRLMLLLSPQSICLRVVSSVGMTRIYDAVRMTLLLEVWGVSGAIVGGCLRGVNDVATRHALVP